MPILSGVNRIPRIDTYFFNIHSKIVLPSNLGLPKGLFPLGLTN